MKKLFLATFMFAQTSLAALNANMQLHTMSCHRVFGNSVFDSFSVTFKVDPIDSSVSTETNAYRKVDLTLNYQRSDLDSARFPAQFHAVSNLYNVVHGDFQINYDDLNDYAAGSIDFSKKDERLGNLAIVTYSSDGIDAFAVFQCENLPRLTW